MAEEKSGPQYLSNPYQLTSEQNRWIFESVILPIHYGGLRSVANPSVHFFGGQPGSGKSVTEGKVIKALVSVDGPGSVAEISIDSYRSEHPAYSRLMSADEENLGTYTNQDCWLWSEQAKDYVLRVKSHVIQEGTLRDPLQTLVDVGRYLDNGFLAELHIMAVHEFVSRLRYLSRYLREVEYSGNGRIVPRSLHDEAYQQLPESLAVMTDAKMFQRVTIHDLNGQVAEQVISSDADSVNRVLTAMMVERDSSRLDKRALVDDIDRQVERAQYINKPTIIGELKGLRNDVESS